MNVTEMLASPNMHSIAEVADRHLDSTDQALFHEVVQRSLDAAEVNSLDPAVQEAYAAGLATGALAAILSIRFGGGRNV